MARTFWAVQTRQCEWLTERNALITYMQRVETARERSAMISPENLPCRMVIADQSTRSIYYLRYRR